MRDLVSVYFFPLQFTIFALLCWDVLFLDYDISLIIEFAGFFASCTLLADKQMKPVKTDSMLTGRVFVHRVR